MSEGRVLRAFAVVILFGAVIDDLTDGPHTLAVLAAGLLVWCLGTLVP